MKKATIAALFISFGLVSPLICRAAENNDFVSAKKAYDENKYFEATQAFNRVLKKVEDRQVPNQPMSEKDADQIMEIHNYLGKIHKIEGDYESAIKEFQETDGMSDSADSCASYLLGEIFYLQDKREYAVEYWKMAIRESFDTECLLYAYVMYYITAKADGKEADELKEIPWKLKNDKWLQSIINYWRGKNTEKRLMEQASTLSRKVFANYIIGKKNLNENKHQVAKEYFKQAIKTDCRDCIGYDLAKKEIEKK